MLRNKIIVKFREKHLPIGHFEIHVFLANRSSKAWISLSTKETNLSFYLDSEWRIYLALDSVSLQFPKIVDERCKVIFHYLSLLAGVCWILVAKLR